MAAIMGSESRGRDLVDNMGSAAIMGSESMGQDPVSSLGDGTERQRLRPREGGITV